MTETDDFHVSLPANARIASMEFGDNQIRVQLDDGGSERIVSPASIAAIHGAEIRSAGLHPAPLASPTMVEVMLGKEGVAVTEARQYVIALRAAKLGEFWYLVADTFNFRKSLGADAGNVLEQNLRTLLTKLTTLAPQAVQDSFVTALLANLPLPPPLGSLMEFFKVVSR
jgi:hypothetical protein